ncbi:uracil-DNA glycosylase [Pelagibacteraceae bacterium]|nr:uracil-DNA glycosylase [Pelagibacteraceae bacterium]
MVKKINTKFAKLIKYYSLINHNLIYENEAINRYKINSNLAIKGSKGKELQKLKQNIIDIKNCELKKNSKNIVFSDGNPNSKVMIIGEGPGANEDLEGVPFIGKTGELLDKMLLSINLNRDNVYITNVVNYRPPENRNPTVEEITRYLPFLIKHIEIIDPKILILLGSSALGAVIGDKQKISEIRGKWINKNIGKSNIFVIVSFHPAFLMRQPAQKAMSWIDLKMIRKKISDLKIKIEK